MATLETINNAASAAVKAVWGEPQHGDADHPSQSSAEPVSGKQGDTSKGEPYDAGNMDNPPITPAVETGPPTAVTTTTTAATQPPPQQDSLSSDAAPVAAATTKPTTTPADINDPLIPDTDPSPAVTKSDVDNAGVGPNAAVDNLDKTSAGPAETQQDVKSTEPKADDSGLGARNTATASEATAPTSQKDADHSPDVKNGDDSKDKDSHSSGSGSGKEKRKSIGSKIKDKLHLHHHH